MSYVDDDGWTECEHGDESFCESCGGCPECGNCYCDEEIDERDIYGPDYPGDKEMDRRENSVQIARC